MCAMIVMPAPTWEVVAYEKPKLSHLASQADGVAYKTTYQLRAHHVTVVINGRFSARSETFNAIKTTIITELQSLHGAEAKTVQSKLEEIGSRYSNLALKATITPRSAEEMDSQYLKEKKWLDISTEHEFSAKKIFLFEDETKKELSINVSGDPKYARKWMDTIKKIDEHIVAMRFTSATFEAIIAPFKLFTNPITIEHEVLVPLVDREEFDFPAAT